MFKRAPLLVRTNADLVRNGGDVGDMGITTRPVGTVMPDFQVTATQKKDGRWWARVQIHRRAAEGSNHAAYLAPGDYRTGKGAWLGGAIGPYNAAFCPAGEIVGRVSQQISTLSQRAETEHCSDILRAYTLTVTAAQAALDAAVAASPIGPGNKRDAVMRQVRAFVTQNLHARLARVFRDNIQIDAMVNRHGFQTDLHLLFIAVADLTLNRDNTGNHTFNLGAAVPDDRWFASWRAPLPAQDLRTIVTGPLFQVPGPPTNTLIHL